MAGVEFPTTSRKGEQVTVRVEQDRTRRGCDCCLVDIPTERFVGLNGHVLWICGGCLQELQEEAEDGQPEMR